MSVTAITKPDAQPAGPSRAVTVTLNLDPGQNPADDETIQVLEMLRHLLDREGDAPLAPRNTTSRGTATDSTGFRTAEPEGSDPDPETIRIYPAPRSVFRGAVELPLTRMEFDLLLFLAERPRQVFTRRQLLSSVWDNVHTGERTVDVHIRRLRAKLGEDVPLMKTVRCVGYRLDDGAKLSIIERP